MTNRPYLTAEELPPKPDPDTGEPRPPRAPGLVDKKKSAEEEIRGRVTDPAKAPAPPEGEGPLLAWYKSSRRAALLVTAWGLPLLVVGVTLLQGFSIEWMKFWQLWALIVLFLAGLYSLQRTVVCSAGAEWLKVGKTWVRLYELVEVKAKHRSNAIHLDFKDGGGREVMVEVDDLQGNRDVWDLVYNGILHSVIAGEAKTNGLVHSALDVPRLDRRQHG